MTSLGALALMLAVTSAVLARVAPVGAPSLADPDAAALRLVRPSWSVARWEGLRLMVIAGAAAIALPLGWWPAVPLTALLPSLALRHAAAGARERSARAAIDVLRATHAAMRSGLPVVAALRIALDRVPATGRAPFDEMLRAFELSGGRFVTSARVDRRTALALDALGFLAAGDLPASRGAALVGSVADRLVFEQRLSDEVRARSAGARTQIVILALLVPGLALYLTLTMPGLAATLGTPLGRFVLLPAALLFEVAGIVASRTIIRSVVP